MPRCEVTPQAGHQVELTIDGRECCRWHFGPDYPRPYLFPLRGPSGAVLTRMGHPGAPNHDHHQSVWFAHAKLLGIDFWSNSGSATIRQQEWLVYEDGDAEGVMAVRLGWYDGHEPKELLRQEVVVALHPDLDGQYQLEIQSTLTPAAKSIELQQTPFGLLAVRVAKSLSAYFGKGVISDSEGRRGEPAIFAKPARWVDYSGPVQPPGVRDPFKTVTEGITYFDHPSNDGYPNTWHVREDGWMGLSINRLSSRVIEQGAPLTYRFLLDVHREAHSATRARRIADRFAKRPPFLAVRRSKAKHRQYEVRRADGDDQ